MRRAAATCCCVSVWADRLHSIVEAPTKYLSFVVRTIVAEIVLRNLELYPVPVVLTLNRLNRFRFADDNTGRIIAPSSANA